MKLFFVLLMLTSSTAVHAAEDAPATMIIVGRVWTGDSRRPRAEAVAIRGDKVLAVGSREEIDKLRTKQTQVIDAVDGMVVPGLIDSHIHLIDGGLQLASVQLRDAKTREEFVRRIGEFAKKKRPGRVDHGRRLGSYAVGRRVAVARLDRFRDAR